MNSLENVTERFFSYLGRANGEQIICIVACVVAVCMDPFFLYIPFLSHTKKCLGMNTNLWLVAVVVRSVADLAYYFGSNRVVADILFKSILSRHRSKISDLSMREVIKTDLLMYSHIFAYAPIPQVLFSQKFILKTLRGYTFWNWILFCHYGTRLLLIFQACEYLKTRVSVSILGRFNAPVYLILYIIVSHLIGASWYYLSIQRQVSCWQHACKIDTGCVQSFFHCDGTTTSTLNSTLVNEFCLINPLNATVFDYGIYADALQSGIVEDKRLLKKFLRCLFWGLRNLSSFASNLQTSTNGGETFFAIIISILALILLIYIIGNIQRYAELASARSEGIVDKMKLIKPIIEILVKRHSISNFTETVILEHIQKALEKGNESFNSEILDLYLQLNSTPDSLRKDLLILESRILNPKKLKIQEKAEKWLLDNNIPRDQNNDILFYSKCGLKDDEDVNLTSVLSVLPDESKWMTMKDLCFDTLKKVEGLKNIDEEWFISMSSKLKPVVYPKESYIFREGEPLDFIIFITSGVAWSYTTRTNAGSKSLQKGDFFGEELVQWKLDTDINRRELESDRIPLSCVPISTANVKSHTQVEALVLMTKDLALSSDFPVATSKLRRIIRKRMVVNAFIRKRTADSATQRVDRRSRTEEVPSVRREIEEEDPSVRTKIDQEV